MLLVTLPLGAPALDVFVAAVAAMLAPMCAGFLAIAATLAQAYRISSSQLLRGE
jgi:hypothetical protein